MAEKSKKRSARGAEPMALLLFGAAAPSEADPKSFSLITYKPILVDLARLDALSPPWLRASESKSVRAGQPVAPGHRRLFENFVEHLAARASRETKVEGLGTAFVRLLSPGSLRDKVGMVAAFRPDAPAEDFAKAGLEARAACDAWAVAFRDAFIASLDDKRRTRAWRVWSDGPEGLASSAMRQAMDFKVRDEDEGLLGAWAPALEAERERAELAAVKPSRRKAAAAEAPAPSRARRI